MGMMPRPLIEQAHRQLVERRPGGFGLVSYPEEPLVIADEPVLPPAQRLAEEHSQSHPYDVFARLVHLRLETKDEEQTRNDLIAAVTPLLLQAEEFERQIVAARSTQLEKEWKQCKKECRVQAAVVAKLDADWNSTEASIRALSSQYDHDLNELRAMQHAPLPRWASSREIADKNILIAQARQQAEESSMARSKALQTRVQIEQDLKQAQEKMNELTCKEVRLKHALNGAPYNDFELGLEVK
jgi:septal ring factor EnvC (AmiA/AmiB activator)